MTTYESKIKTLNHSQEVIYTSLSDLNNLALIQNRIPQDKLKDLSFDTDSVNMTVDKLGKISL
nr:SRPBCC family protein [Bacteroidales bacterium]